MLCLLGGQVSLGRALFQVADLCEQGSGVADYGAARPDGDGGHVGDQYANLTLPTGLDPWRELLPVFSVHKCPTSPRLDVVVFTQQ